jgi:hypothetical protein
MARPASRALLNELARGQRPLTHEILDQFPPGRSLAHLRAVLVAAGGLPPRDERMASLQRWITTVISERGDAREREILDQYARWYLLRRLRGRLTHARSGGQRQAGQRHMTEREKDNIRNGVLAAIRLLDLAAGKQLTLAGISQADLETWAADGKFTYGHCTATFIRWAVAGKHSRPGLKVHYDSTGHAHRRAHDTERRWQDARRLLHDETLPLPDRISGLLVLLYAQNPADIEGLTTAAIDDNGTTITLTLASVPIVLPDPLTGLMREHLATRRGHATIGQPGDVPWLFPGGGPVIPSTPGASATGSKPSGCTRAPTVPPRCSPWPPSCPPRCSPGCSASASAPRSAGRKPPPATGWPTPQPSAAGHPAAQARSIIRTGSNVARRAPAKRDKEGQTPLL